MRVLQINSALAWGGGETHTLLLADGLRARGSAVTLAGRPGSMLDERARVVGIPFLPLALRGEWDIGSARRIAAHCRRHHVGVIHAHLARDYPVAALAARLARSTGLVATRHVLFPLRMWLALRAVVDRIDAFIAVSEAVRRSLVEASGVPAAKVTTIHAGIEDERYLAAPSGVLRAELGLAADVPVVGAVGRIAREKGYEHLLEAMAAVRQAHRKARCVIAGGTEDARYARELRTLTDRLGLGRCVHWLGHRWNVPEIMRDLDLLVLPSLREPFGLVLLEAMAAGTPVVATAAGGVGEIVTDGVHGVLVAPGDSAALAAAVGALLADPDTARRHAEAGRERMLAEFSATAMTDRTLALYRAIVPRRP